MNNRENKAIYSDYPTETLTSREFRGQANEDPSETIFETDLRRGENAPPIVTVNSEISLGCLDCAREFANLSGIKLHFKNGNSHILIPDEVIPTACKSCRCPICHRSFINLPLHLRSHIGDTLAQFGEMLKSSKGLDTHQSIQNDTPVKQSPAITKTYECQICKRHFQDLRPVSGNQIGEQMFVCEPCGNALGSLQNFEVRERTQTVLPAAPYSIQNLTVPRRSHTNEKPFKSSQCDEEFENIEDLIEHEECYSADNSYVCPECGDRFMHYEFLEHHSEIHRPRKYICTFCGAGYAVLAKLTSHIINNHKTKKLIKK